VHAADEVAQMVLESRVTIYAIGIFDQNDKDQNPMLLQHLARVSGGDSFLEVQLPEVNGICRQIAADIRARYTIGYVPARSGEQGALRKIKVTASTSFGQHLVVHTRTKYVLPPNPPLVDFHSDPIWKP
jgi:hypothetical protein